jgi:hypothetical protein
MMKNKTNNPTNENHTTNASALYDFNMLTLLSVVHGRESLGYV